MGTILPVAPPAQRASVRPLPPWQRAACGRNRLAAAPVMPCGQNKLGPHFTPGSRRMQFLQPFVLENSNHVDLVTAGIVGQDFVVGVSRHLGRALPLSADPGPAPTPKPICQERIAPVLWRRRKSARSNWRSNAPGGQDRRACVAPASHKAKHKPILKMPIQCGPPALTIY